MFERFFKSVKLFYDHFKSLGEDPKEMEVRVVYKGKELKYTRINVRDTTLTIYVRE